MTHEMRRLEMLVHLHKEKDCRCAWCAEGREILAWAASLEQARDRLKAELEPLYWLFTDPVCRADDFEVEERYGNHESRFDALRAAMEKHQARKSAPVPSEPKT
jgi:hypothetical protein